MCGIAAILKSSQPFGHNSIEPFGHDSIDTLISAVKRRGPDAFSAVHTHSVALYASVLALRGKLTPQPFDLSGNLLMFNGEVYSGLDVDDLENDTAVLANKLLDKDDDQIMECMSKVKGEWAFIYFQLNTNKLFFGRDFLGRRSLLYHLPNNSDDSFMLSSVSCDMTGWDEVPTTGLFCIDLNSQDEFNALNSTNPSTKMIHFPWNHKSFVCI
jgi:asparagine synthetase B (glutamine-hydrolysing)